MWMRLGGKLHWWLGRGRRQCFYFPWKSKVPVKAIFAHFFDFLHGRKIFFTGTFWGFFPFSSRVQKIGFTGRIYQKVIIFAGKIAQNFSRAPIFFTGGILTKIFTGTIFLSRALFGQKPRFFHGRIFFFHGEKKKPWISRPQGVQLTVFHFIIKLCPETYFDVLVSEA